MEITLLVPFSIFRGYYGNENSAVGNGKRNIALWFLSSDAKVQLNYY